MSVLTNDQPSTMQELQVTKGSYGHMLNSIQVFSQDDQWVVYDTRNDPTHISRTCCVEKVNISTGEIKRLYSAPGQTLDGPGVGAAAWNPRENKLIFIHGLFNCDEARPYGFTRRFGAILHDGASERVVSAEARSISVPLIAGALRGGTHAHSWSADGEWLTFTYNDFVMEQLERQSGAQAKDLRTIGVMSPVKAVKIDDESHENFSGLYFSTVAATVMDNPQPGTDDIEKAFDECWVGTNGYIKSDGTRQKRAVAFQGHLRQRDGSVLTEIFISDIPEDITLAKAGTPLQGTMSTRPAVPDGLHQRRVTHTSNRKFPGLQGPRFWLRSSPDGSRLYFLMKDDDGIVQVFEALVSGRDIRQVTQLPADVQAQFNISPDGNSLAVIADNSIWTVDVNTGKGSRITPRTSNEAAPVTAVVWNRTGNTVVYNRYVKGANESFLQIFKVKVN